jgi:hypothetical protein
MPSLSIDLPGPRDFDHCWSCGRVGRIVSPLEFIPVEEWIGPKSRRADDVLEIWREHDEQDRVQDVYLVLCGACSKKLIEPHPRLYSQPDTYSPRPGSMPECVGCGFCRELRCAHPNLKANGGAGLKLSFPKPSLAHICRRGTGHRSGWQWMWAGPVNCPSKEPPTRPAEGNPTP